MQRRSGGGGRCGPEDMSVLDDLMNVDNGKRAKAMTDEENPKEILLHETQIC